MMVYVERGNSHFGGMRGGGAAAKKVPLNFILWAHEKISVVSFFASLVNAVKYGECFYGTKTRAARSCFFWIKRSRFSGGKKQQNLPPK
jgi:hypothetical protein